MVPALEFVEECQAQYWVPKPDGLSPWAVAITYWTLLGAGLPKWVAARTASAARSDWLGDPDAADPVSYYTLAAGKGDVLGCPTKVLELVTDAQFVVPRATPSQYCVVEVLHVSELPKRPP
jgi:hypothetical protein